MGKITNENSLAIQHPDLAKQWDCDTNKKPPSEYSVGSHEEVAWIGICGHHWNAVIKDRVRGYGCPICAGKRVIHGINDLAYVYPNLAGEWDYQKNQNLEPTMVAAQSHKKVYWICKRGHSYETSIDNRVRGRGCPYCGRKKVIEGKTDLESNNPFLASEWNFDKNADLLPSQVFANSHQKVWWRCSLCDSEWQARIDSRLHGNGCPKCAKRLQTSFPEQAIFYYVKKSHSDAINGYRVPFERVMELDIFVPSLKLGIEYDGAHWHRGNESQRRELEKYAICKQKGICLIRIKENVVTDYERDCDEHIVASSRLNDTIRSLSKYILMPTDIDIERDKPNIYFSYISYMKENSLATLYPESKIEWHPSKNGDLTPEMFSFRTNLKFWWVCPLGHEYQNAISHQTTGHKCPYCAHRKLLKGYNDLATTHKYLLVEWDYETNAEIGVFPDSVMAGSNKKVWWKCREGHRWQASIQGKSSGHGCPVCSSHLIQRGVNDFASSHPDLVKEWHPTKNKDVEPHSVSVSSNRKVWWICSLGHEWQAMVESRHKGTGCPYCSNRRVWSGYNDLQTLKPELALQWSEKNNELIPSRVTCGSGKKVWWKCQNDHEWQAYIKDRSRGAGCPFCYRERLQKIHRL